MTKWGYRYIECVATCLCQDWGTSLQLKEVLNELAIIMWLSLPLPVATQCKLQTLNDHSTSHSDNTSKVYEAKSKILCKTKEQPTPVEGTVKGIKYKHHFVSVTHVTYDLSPVQAVSLPGCLVGCSAMVLASLRLETQSTTTGLMAKHCYTASLLSMVSSHFTSVPPSSSHVLDDDIIRGASGKHWSPKMDYMQVV